LEGSVEILSRSPNPMAVANRCPTLSAAARSASDVACA